MTKRDIVAVVSVVVAVLAFAGLNAQDTPEPLELKLIGETECADGWTQVGEVERGVTVYYRTHRGAYFPNWITWERFEAHFAGVPDGDWIPMPGVRPEQRITCRWAPRTIGSEPA